MLFRSQAVIAASPCVQRWYHSATNTDVLAHGKCLRDQFFLPPPHAFFFFFTRTWLFSYITIMVTDTTLSYLSNALGSSALVLIIAYHVRMPPLTPRFSPSRRSAKSTRSRMQACRPKRARPPRTKPLYHTPVLNSQAPSLHRSRPPPPDYCRCIVYIQLDR